MRSDFERDIDPGFPVLPGIVPRKMVVAGVM
jgi:hypothetical protein